jgi:hypothetical protein
MTEGEKKKAPVSYKDVRLAILEGGLSSVKGQFLAGDVSRDVLKTAAEAWQKDGKATTTNPEALAFLDWLSKEVFVDRSLPPTVGEIREVKSRAEQVPGEKGVERPLDTPFVRVDLNTIGVDKRGEEVAVAYGDGFVLIAKPERIRNLLDRHVPPGPVSAAA